MKGQRVNRRNELMHKFYAELQHGDIPMDTALAMGQALATYLQDVADDGPGDDKSKEPLFVTAAEEAQELVDTLEEIIK